MRWKDRILAQSDFPCQEYEAGADREERVPQREKEDITFSSAVRTKGSIK
jgi:hypothetical protein